MYWRGVPYIKKKARHSRSAPSNIKKISTNEGSKVTFKKIFLVIKKKKERKKRKMARTRDYTRGKSSSSSSHMPMSMKSLPMKRVALKSLPAHYASTDPDKEASRISGKIDSIQKPRTHKTPAQRERALDAEIRHQQKETGMVFAREPFLRVVRKILADIAETDFDCPPPMIQKKAFELIQCVTEAHLTGLFSQWWILARHQKLKTILPKHIDCYREQCAVGMTKSEWA